MNRKNLMLVLVAILLSATTSIATIKVYEKRQYNADYFSPTAKDKVPVKFASMSDTKIGSTDLTYAAERTVHSVVHVKVKQEVKNSIQEFGDPFFDFFFGQPRSFQQPEATTGAGSGVIISTDGYIVTNNHVIDNAAEIEVTLNDKRTFKAKVIGTDPSTDVALIKIDATDLQPITIGNSDNLKVGEWVLAIGNPFNLTSTVTAGIISAKAREMDIVPSERKIESFIQTDAAINPGNSGGALVNTAGELVGINTAIASQTGSYIGYGFAIPTTIVSKVVRDLKDYGIVQRAVLGVKIANINDKLAKDKNLKTMDGAYVDDVVSNSSAKDAGIKQGDIIVAINDVRIKSVAELQEQVAAYRPGDNINVTVNRNNKEITLRVTLKNSSKNTNIVKAVDMDRLGATLEPLSIQTKQRLNYNGGLLVDEVQRGGLFAKAGIYKGFIILKINNKTVSSVKEVKEIYTEALNSEATDKVLLVTGINRAGVIKHYVVDLN
jgi:peptidase Do